jgi:hypothetical protein
MKVEIGDLLSEAPTEAEGWGLERKMESSSGM